jgi:hypothetical protein
MVFRKPYAFFIKHFRLFHFILFGLTIYSIVRATGVINFIAQYLSNATAIDNLITTEDVDSVFNNMDYIISIITFIMSLILLVIMTMKQKKNKFYAYSTVISIIMLILNIRGKNTLNVMTTVWISSIELEALSNLYLFAIMALIAQASIALSRAVGFNISRFDFNSDLIKLQTDESDNEEVEFVVDFDVNDLKRGIQKRSRYVKYFIKENSKTLLWCVGVFGGITVLYFAFSMFKGKVSTISTQKLKNTNIYGFSIEYNDSYVINTDSKGNKLADNKTLLVVDLTMKNLTSSDKLFPTAIVNIMIGDNVYSTSSGYQNKVADLGKVYTAKKLRGKQYSKNTDGYSPEQGLFVFEISERQMKGNNIYLHLVNPQNSTTYDVRLLPKSIIIKENTIIESKLKEEYVFESNTLKDSKLKINSIEISDNFVLTYNDGKYKEYIPGKIVETNEDMAIMKINGIFDSNNSLINNFYNFLNSYAYIEYKIGDKTYKQTAGFNRIIPKKVKEKNIYYVTILDKIRKSDSAKLVFSIRGNDYVYSLDDAIKGGN